MLICASAQNPAKPAAQAPAKSTTKPHQAGQSPASTPASLDPGGITSGTYHNAFFGFAYHLPYGWVDRTQDMQEGSEPGKSMTLFSVFERPPEANQQGVNSAVVIAAESAANYPDLTDPAQYFGVLTGVTAANGFKVTGEARYVAVGTKQLVRGDYSKEVGKQTMYQGTLVLMEKGYLVSFTFIGGTENEVNDLIENLSFGGKKVAR